MKPSVFDRILLVLALLFLIGVSVLFLCVATQILPEEYVVYNAELAYSGVEASLIVGGAGLLLLIISLRILVAFNRKPAAPRTTSALVGSNEIGATHISLAAVDNLVQRHCRANGKIRECTSGIFTLDGGLRITLKLAVLPETNVPQFTEELKGSLKAYLEEHAGIPVKEISILIVAASTAYKPVGE